MMKKMFFILLSVYMLNSCGNDDKVVVKKENIKPEPIKKEFSRKNMLIFWADYVIMPGYEDLVSTSIKMKTAIKQFTTSPSEDNLKSARDAWEQTYVVWQKVSITQMGKAKSVEGGLTARLNSFPTNVAKISKNIEEGNYDFSLGKMTTAEGLPALDYMLNGPNELTTDTEIVEFYKNNEGYKKYINDLTKDVNNLAIDVRDDWKYGYRNKFIEKDGNGLRSNVTKVIKYFVNTFYEVELLEKKIARPSAANTSHKYPKKVEAYYKKDLSKKLYVVALKSAIDFYNGKSYDGSQTGHGLKQYLEFLGNNKDLTKSIDEHFKSILEVNETLGDNFYDQINHPDKRTRISKDTYNKLNILKRIFKTDMMSAMSLSDGGSDADSDND